jgi:hypothetical protein
MKRLGIVGTMVWDTIHGRGDSERPIEEWGGIAYALAALEVSLPPDWEMVPLIKVGRDLAERANTFLVSLTKRSGVARFIEVDEPNNRVTIRYVDSTRRAERLSGGVPAWRWPELGPLVRDLDSIYVNFISGFEMSLETAQQLRHGFDGPIYADLHSLLLGVTPDGLRVPRRLPDVASWLECFDAVQINEDELRLIGDDPLAVAATAFHCGVGLLLVTLEERGAVYFTTGRGSFIHMRERRTRPGGPVTTERIAAPAVDPLDPTGCGDVFGGTMVAQLLAGTAVPDAVRAANAVAARNVQYRGATGLHHHLRGEIVRQ